jgi:hypothetical protein
VDKDVKGSRSTEVVARHELGESALGLVWLGPAGPRRDQITTLVMCPVGCDSDDGAMRVRGAGALDKHSRVECKVEFGRVLRFSRLVYPSMLLLTCHHRLTT